MVKVNITMRMEHLLLGNQDHSSLYLVAILRWSLDLDKYYASGGTELKANVEIL